MSVAFDEMAGGLKQVQLAMNKFNVEAEAAENRSDMASKMAGGLKQMQQAMNKLRMEAETNRSNMASKLAEQKEPLLDEIAALKRQVESLNNLVALNEEAKILAVQKKRDKIIKLLNVYEPSSKPEIDLYDVNWRVYSGDQYYPDAPKPLLAAMLDDFAKVQKLIDGGTDFGETFEPGASVASVVAEGGSPEMLKLIVETHPEILNHDAEVSLLFSSVHAGNFKNTKLLVELGACADSIQGDGNTPVHIIWISGEWLAFLELLSKASGFDAALKMRN
jgi:hypothetical protein